jgi:hypothetical protein
MLAVVGPARALEVEQYTVDETANAASTIFVGHVLNHQSRWGDGSKRWMMTDYTFQVQDALLGSENIQPGGTLTLSFWGGTIDGETQSIGGFQPPEDGKQYLMMLQPDWASGQGFTPCVAFNNGFFVVADGGAKMLDADGQPLVSTGAGKIERPTVVEGASVQAGVSLNQLLGYLRTNIGRIKALPARQNVGLSANNPDAMPTFAKEGVVEPRQMGNATRSSESTIPVQPGTERQLATPVAPEGAEVSVVHAQVKEGSERSEMDDPEVMWSRFGKWASTPIVVNSFQDSFGAPWTPEDQYQMSKWNYYSDIFRVRNPRTGTFGWGNFINDLAGFPNSQTLQNVYGQPWGAGTLAITFTRSLFGFIIEADIAFNPAYAWTVDDAAVYLNTTTAWPYRQSMLHEMGHMWGADHNFNFLSVMNYSPKVYRAYCIPFMDDAEGVRATYSVVNRTDLGAYMFRSTGFQSWADANFPSTVVAGNSFSLTNFHIENVGTATINSPTLEFYLSSHLDFSHSYHFLGTRNYGPPLARFGWYNPATVGVTLTVPTSVPGGDYYVADFIRNDGGAVVGSFPWDNNHGFTRGRIRVLPRLISLTLTPSTVVGGSSSLGRVNLGSNAGPGGMTIFLSSNNTSVATVPSSVFIPAGSNTATFTVSTVGVPMTRTALISGSSNGISQSATLTVLPPALVNVVLNPTQVIGGSSSLGRVNLGSNAGPGGLLIPLSSSDTTVATVPANVLVPSGSNTATFNVSTVGVPAIRTPSINASSNGVTRSAILTVLPPALVNVVLNPTQVSGGDTSTCTVSLGSNAGPGGLTVDLSSSDTSVVTVPASVLIPSGSSSASFTASSSAVLTRSTALITALSNGVSRFATLTVTSPTSIAVSDVFGSPGDIVTLSATLTRNADGAGIPGVTVTFLIDGLAIDFGTTDDSGLATLDFTIPGDFDLGDHIITVQFDGDSDYEPSSMDGVLSVN